MSVPETRYEANRRLQDPRRDAEQEKHYQGILDGLASGALEVRHSIEGVGTVVSFSSKTILRHPSGRTVYPKLRIEFGRPRYRSFDMDIRNPFLAFEAK